MEPVAVDTHVMEDEEVFSPRENEGWAGVCEILRGSVGEDSFQRWFRAAAWAGERRGGHRHRAR
jgi:hypothetical protein